MKAMTLDIREPWFYQSGNVFLGSDRRLRYQIVPGEDILTAEAWEGPWSYQLSQVEERKEFPLDEAGLQALGEWITKWSADINARPPRSLADTIQARDARRAQLEETPTESA